MQGFLEGRVVPEGETDEGSTSVGDGLHDRSRAADGGLRRHHQVIGTERRFVRGIDVDHRGCYDDGAERHNSPTADHFIATDDRHYCATAYR